MTNEAKSTYTHVAVDFMASDGARVTSVQMVEDGKVVALADYINGERGRTMAKPPVDLDLFLDEAQQLVENSTPIRFQEVAL